MHDSKQDNQDEKCSETPDFNVGDEVELLTWRIFGTKGTITSMHSSVFRHPFHVRADRGYTVGVFPHEIRHAVSEAATTAEKQSALSIGTKSNKKGRHG